VCIDFGVGGWGGGVWKLGGLSQGGDSISTPPGGDTKGEGLYETSQDMRTTQSNCGLRGVLALGT